MIILFLHLYFIFCQPLKAVCFKNNQNCDKVRSLLKVNIRNITAQIKTDTDRVSEWVSEWVSASVSELHVLIIKIFYVFRLFTINIMYTRCVIKYILHTLQKWSGGFHTGDCSKVNINYKTFTICIHLWYIYIYSICVSALFVHN